MEHKERPSMVSMSGLKTRGWTATMIRAFLDKPDREAPNPHYRSAAPMKLYFLWRIEAIEATTEWAISSVKASTISALAKKAAESRRCDLLDEINRLSVSIPQLSRKELVFRACKHYNAYALERDKDSRADSDSDKAFLDRITVNYLRHEMSIYEDSLDQVYGRIGAEAARGNIRMKVYEAIAETYPELAEECTRQLAHRNAATVNTAADTSGRQTNS